MLPWASDTLLPWVTGDAALDSAALQPWSTWEGHICYKPSGVATFGRPALRPWASSSATMRAARCGLGLAATGAAAFWEAAGFAASGNRCSCRRQAALLLAAGLHVDDATTSLGRRGCMYLLHPKAEVARRRRSSGGTN
jgi:hypothetical protein